MKGHKGLEQVYCENGKVKAASKSHKGYRENEFEHHVMTIYAGEDVEKKIMSYFQEVPCFGTILSARGLISRVTLHQYDSERVTYEGRYGILSLKGGYSLIEQNGQPEENRHMNIILNTVNGTRTFGGPVAGSLIAATNIQATLLRCPSY